MTPPETMAPPAEHAAVGDPAALQRLLRFGGRKLLDSLAEMYLSHAPARIVSLREALARGDARGAELAAHSLKSSSAQLGAPVLERLCRAAEGLARSNDLAGVDALAADMERELAAFADWLSRARQTLEQT